LSAWLASQPVPDLALAQAENGDVFLSTVFIEGVPYEEARLAGTVFWQRYVDVLMDPAQQDTWGNAVVAIGASGQPGAERSLIDFFNRLPTEAPLDGAACRAAYAVPIALAYHANNSRAPAALQFLSRAANGDTDFEWRCVYHSTNQEARSDLQNVSIRSLGLSGIDDADPILRQLEARALDGDRREALRDALEAHALVKQLGLAQYYTRPEPQSETPPIEE
jgi:hypothetical protein